MNEFQFAELLSGLRKEGYCAFAANRGILPREKGSPMGRFCGKLPGAGSRILCRGVRIKKDVCADRSPSFYFIIYTAHRLNLQYKIPKRRYMGFRF